MVVGERERERLNGCWGERKRGRERERECESVRGGTQTPSLKPKGFADINAPRSMTIYNSQTTQGHGSQVKLVCPLRAFKNLQMTITAHLINREGGADIGAILRRGSRSSFTGCHLYGQRKAGRVPLLLQPFYIPDFKQTSLARQTCFIRERASERDKIHKVETNLTPITTLGYVSTATLGKSFALSVIADLYIS